MAHTIGTQGLGVLLNLGSLILTLYLGLTIFVVLIFGLVMLIARVPVRQFVRAVREPATIAFATTSSESALPKAMQAMERMGALFSQPSLQKLEQLAPLPTACGKVQR